jgi:hypothetical protein
MSCGAVCPERAADQGRSTPTRRTASGFTPIQTVGPQVRARSTDGKNAPRHALLRLVTTEGVGTSFQLELTAAGEAKVYEWRAVHERAGQDENKPTV